ncbi:TasA family protein [Enterococcus sp. AZ177]|uniref:TasA family protein n=1 Tax=unclassified Enterococcus TaxID=2608891 RepID=UPI003D300063
MKSKKKVVHFLWILPVLAVLLLIGSVTAYAAMMMSEEKVNLFQVGNLQTKVKEVFTEPTTIKPNESVTKEVSVENTGTVDQFVRVMLQPEIRLENGESTRLLPSKIGEEVLLELNLTDWTLGEDGYYYYLNVLKSGTPSNTTKNLFTEVKLKQDLGLEYHNATFNLLVKVEAINCAKYAYRDAWWQGSTPSSGALEAIDKKLAEHAE